MTTVLVVEDEWVIAEVLAVTLVDAGYHVITAANANFKARSPGFP